MSISRKRATTITTPAEHQPRWWRSRAFLRPLRITIVGVAGPPAIVIGFVYLSNVLGHGPLGLVAGFIFLGVWAVILLITGLIVG